MPVSSMIPANSVADMNLPKVHMMSRNKLKKAARSSLRTNLRTNFCMESMEERRLFSSVLGTAATFGALGGSTVTNTGATIVTGDIGVWPGSAITGFPPGVVTGGAIHANDTAAIAAEANAATAYGHLAGMASTANLSNQDLGGMTLAPGVYTFNGAATLHGTITFDAGNDPNATFVIQIGTTLVTSSSSAVSLINGARASNVFFQVGSSATLGSGTAFKGEIVAFTSITLTTGTSLTGSALALNGAVTMDTNAITAAPPVSSLQVIVGPQAAKFVIFTDAHGVDRTFTLQTAGAAAVNFTGTDLVATNITGGGVRVTSTGNDIAIASIAVTGANRHSVMAFTDATAHAAPLSVGALTSDAAIGSLTGNVDLAGDVAIAGSLGTVRVAGLHGTHFAAASIYTLSVSNDSTPAIVTTGAIGAIAIGGNLTGNVSATTIDSLRVANNMTDSTISLTQRRMRHVNDLGELVVGNALRNTTVNSRGNVGTISAFRLNHDHFYAGVALLNVNHLPTTQAEVSAPKANIGTVSARRTADTDIAAFSVGNVALGWLETANASVPFGITAAQLTTITGTRGANATPFALTPLNTQAEAQAALTHAGLNAAGEDFVVTVL